MKKKLLRLLLFIVGVVTFTHATLQYNPTTGKFFSTPRTSDINQQEYNELIVQCEELRHRILQSYGWPTFTEYRQKAINDFEQRTIPSMMNRLTMEEGSMQGSSRELQIRRSRRSLEADLLADYTTLLSCQTDVEETYSEDIIRYLRSIDTPTSLRLLADLQSLGFNGILLGALEVPEIKPKKQECTQEAEAVRLQEELLKQQQPGLEQASEGQKRYAEEDRTQPERHEEEKEPQEKNVLGMLPEDIVMGEGAQEEVEKSAEEPIQGSHQPRAHLVKLTQGVRISFDQNVSRKFRDAFFEKLTELSPQIKNIKPFYRKNEFTIGIKGTITREEFSKLLEEANAVTIEPLKKESDVIKQEQEAAQKQEVVQEASPEQKEVKEKEAVKKQEVIQNPQEEIEKKAKEEELQKQPEKQPEVNVEQLILPTALPKEDEQPSSPEQQLTPEQVQNELLQAISKDEVGGITQAIDRGANVSQLRDGLLFAIFLNKPNSAKVLLESGVKVDATIALAATKMGDINLALTIVQSGAGLFGLMDDYMRLALECSANAPEKRAVAQKLIFELMKHGYDINNAWSLGLNSVGHVYPTYENAAFDFLKERVVLNKKS